MHSSAFGAVDRMIFRSFCSARRLSSLKRERYSSIVLGLDAIVVSYNEQASFFKTIDFFMAAFGGFLGVRPSRAQQWNDDPPVKRSRSWLVARMPDMLKQWTM